MYYLPYNLNLKFFSRDLRNHSTPGEIKLWKRLRAASMMGYTFNRQKPLDRFIVDFYCKPLNLVIEVDGPYHFYSKQRIKDRERQKILEGYGLAFLRFTEEDVLGKTDWVVEVIREFIINLEKNDPLLYRKKRVNRSNYLKSKTRSSNRPG
ncbi:MAG: endonuclease domain-containing protein [Chitinophagaceae bacterium]|nr:endonuclease domain-containing protein [Chitinophagaceae bacterium]